MVIVILVCGCRSFLTPDRIKGNPAHALNYVKNKSKYYGRFNMGVVTINLADIALSAYQLAKQGAPTEEVFKEFWKIFRVYMVLDTPFDFS